MTVNTPSTLASRLKQRFNKDVSQIVPVPADLIGRLKFRNDIALGASAEFDVQLSLELGFTQGTGNASLNGAIAQTSARASVSAYSLVLQSQVSYDAISRAKKEEQAFARFADNKYIPMVDSFRMREEFLALHGRQGIGVLESNVAGQVITISKQSWNPTLWASIKGATIEAWTAVDGSTQHNGDATVSAVNLATRQVTLVGTVTAFAQGDVIFFKGDHAAGRIGLMHIAKNTGSLYGIDAAVHPLWAANAYDVGTSALTLGKILQMSALSALKGCLGEKLVCYVPVKTFQSLVSDESALVQHAAGKKKAENGFEYLEFFGASGSIEVVPHLYMKEGEVVMFPEQYLYVIGSQEVDNQLAKDGDIIFDLEGSMAKEMRLFSDTCGVFCERPGYITYGTRSDGLGLHE